MTHLRTGGGNATRKSYARIRDVYELPRLIEVQLDSFRWFQTEGLEELFAEISPMSVSTKTLNCILARNLGRKVFGLVNRSTLSRNVGTGT